MPNVSFCIRSFLLLSLVAGFGWLVERRPALTLRANNVADEPKAKEARKPWTTSRVTGSLEDRLDDATAAPVAAREGRPPSGAALLRDKPAARSGPGEEQR